MKNFIFLLIILIAVFASPTIAQDLKQVKNLTDTLNKQAEQIVKLTKKDIDKKTALTGIEIERAFLAEQLLASTKLMKKLVNDKYELTELRSAGNVLIKISNNLPTAGMNQKEWDKIKTTIDSINKELQSEPTKIPEKTPVEIQEEVKVNENNLLGRLFWTGTVDAKVQLLIRGSKLNVETLSGTEYKDGIPSFTAPIPTTGEIAVGAKLRDGRGKISVVQQPNADNDYTTIIEIFDEKGGAKSYTIEIFWSRK